MCVVFELIIIVQSINILKCMTNIEFVKILMEYGLLAVFPFCHWRMLIYDSEMFHCSFYKMNEMIMHQANAMNESFSNETYLCVNILNYILLLSLYSI